MMSVSCARSAVASAVESASSAAGLFSARLAGLLGQPRDVFRDRGEYIGRRGFGQLGKREPFHLVRERLGSNINVGNKAQQGSDRQSQEI